MTDSLSSRRSRKPAKLGMTVQPRKPSIYDKLAQRMDEGAKEERKLARPGTPYQKRLQRRIPKARPVKPGASRA